VDIMYSLGEIVLVHDRGSLRFGNPCSGQTIVTRYTAEARRTQRQVLGAW
jgi:hypothetical protein